jgi:hypothetical protein
MFSLHTQTTGRLLLHFQKVGLGNGKKMFHTVLNIKITFDNIPKKVVKEGSSESKSELSWKLLV